MGVPIVIRFLVRRLRRPLPLIGPTLSFCPSWRNLDSYVTNPKVTRCRKNSAIKSIGMAPTDTGIRALKRRETMYVALVCLFVMPLSGCGSDCNWSPGLTPTGNGNPGRTATKDMDRPIIVPSQAWEGNNIEDGSVIQVCDIYYRFYCAGDAQLNIGYAKSDSAGFPILWTKYANNPVIRASDVYPQSGVAVCAPRLIRMPDGSFRMYVHAFDGIHDRGFLFVSSNFPNIWTLANGGNPIFIEGDPGQWDSYQIQTQIVIPSFDAPDGLWHLFYLGRDSVVLRGGHATSPDGIRWARDRANPVMTPNSGWKAQDVGPVGWLKIGSTYYLTAEGFDGSVWSIGYYSSENLYDLTPSENSVLKGTPGAWDSSLIQGGDILQSDGNVWIFYLGSAFNSHVSGGNYRVGVANWGR